jgi:perosamine synthetase
MEYSGMTEAWPFWKTVPRFDREYAFSDLAAAVSTLVHSPENEDDWIKQLFSPASFHFARSGRECLFLVLKILKLPPRSRVGVPLYCCASVFESVVAAGHTPVFLDLDLDTYTLDLDFLRRKRQSIDALIVVHTFGYPANLNGVREALGDRYIPVIEDCAHALFSEFQGQLLGTTTDASFHTFGMHKPAAVGGGAVLFINNPELVLGVQRELASLRIESRLGEIRHSLVCLARSISYHRLSYGALLASPIGVGRDRTRWAPPENGMGMVNDTFTPARIRSVDRVLVAKRVREFRTKLPSLSRNTANLRDAVAGTTLTLPSEPGFGVWNHFMVPVRYANAEKREKGRRLLISRRVDTSPLYQNCARNATRFGYVGGCHRAEHAAQTVCTVPNHAWLADEELAYIGEALRLSA